MRTVLDVTIVAVVGLGGAGAGYFWRELVDEARERGWI
jgi:hypothetical protein